MKIEKLFEELFKNETSLKEEEKRVILEKKEKQLDSVDRVFLARYKNRPKGRDFIENLITDPIFLHGDRYFSEDASTVCGVGSFSNRVVNFIAIHKGRNLEENIRCNFGMVHPEGYRKAVRIMKQAEKFQRPLIIFIDTPGAYPGVGAEERGQSEAIAQSIYTLCGLRTKVISVITGEGASGGAIALGVSDYLIMMENSIYSILSPEGFASILWKDPLKVDYAKEIMKLTSYDLFNFGIADEIVKEKLVYRREDFKENYNRLASSINVALSKLESRDMEDLLEARNERFGQLKWV